MQTAPLRRHAWGAAVALGLLAGALVGCGDSDAPQTAANNATSTNNSNTGTTSADDAGSDDASNSGGQDVAEDAAEDVAPDAPEDTSDDAALDLGEDDASPEDAAEDVVEDAPEPDAAETGGSEPPPCEGACRENTVAADVGARSYPFDVAYYGLTHPSRSDSGAWTLYVEAYFGAPAGCPSSDSPTPDRTLIVSNVPLPDTYPGPEAEVGGALFDFDGAILAGFPFARYDSATAVVETLDICTECAGQQPPSDPDGFVALDVTISLEDGGGEVTGHIFATHCDSLDDVP